MNHNVPKCMSTQHPDNVSSPFFTENSEIGGEDEIMEAYYAFSHLGCDEQMWDCEGKEIDNYVVKKLLTRYRHYFEQERLGKDIFLTLRVPNPTVERAEAKILLETLESIPRSFDASELVFNDEISPIFEVIIPMTTSAKCVDRVYKYYRDFIVGKQNQSFQEGDITIADWIGKFKPDNINVIPLVEDMKHMLDAHNILRRYLGDKNPSYHRIFFARSDPAMNYGLISAVLVNKVALQRIYNLSEKIGVDIYPIIGVGSAPFRGNLRPDTVERVSNEYPSVHTFTVQSAFKYDNPPDQVTKGIKILKERRRSPPRKLDEEKALKMLEKYIDEYTKQIKLLAPFINKLAKYVPKRRKRKLHIGLFGYSRNMDEIQLPRAITFTAALYSIGIPPEILGLNALSDKDLDYIKDVYVGFEEDLKDSLQYFNPNQDYLPESLVQKIDDLSLDYEINEQHNELTTYISNSLKRVKNEDISEQILMAANIRRFLG
ncbi:MAG: phosphoenolpyruvate carboxylase [Candidatus Lokiarchaeota archaeon]|nr:phosphoenolpyruvate carboxylase [Candidatus Lokiarchaeota archaeon]MBD3202548.1 phosphoenolpyruvate carboxylase [Candidatus Lokiarchaeota archaeon]